MAIFWAGILSNYHVVLFCAFLGCQGGSGWDMGFQVDSWGFEYSQEIFCPQKSLRMIRACCTMHQGIGAF